MIKRALIPAIQPKTLYAGTSLATIYNDADGEMYSHGCKPKNSVSLAPPEYTLGAVISCHHSEENYYCGMGCYLHRRAIVGIVPDLAT
jgi:hypothetical protein